jgi:hypothetical protein
MGRVVNGRRLSRSSSDHARVSRGGKDACSLESAHALSAFPLHDDELRFTHRSLHRNSQDERTVRTAYLKPDPANGHHRPADLAEQVRAYLIMARRSYFQQRPDTLTQTFFIPQLFPCSQTADHTFAGGSKSTSGKPVLRPLELEHISQQKPTYQD